MELTLRDRKETKKYDTVTMCLSNAIVYITYGKINGPVFVVACSNGYSSLIAAQNDRAKNRAMGFGILSNDVLMNN